MSKPEKATEVVRVYPSTRRALRALEVERKKTEPQTVAADVVKDLVKGQAKDG